MDNPIASLKLIGVMPGQAPTHIEVLIGTPRARENHWLCPVRLDGLHRLSTASGGDSFQSLCMAIALVQDLLRDFQEKGGTLYFDEDGGSLTEDNVFPLEAYRFSARP